MKGILALWRAHGQFLLGLLLLTALVWQWRFVRSGPNLLPEHVCNSLTHWVGGETINPAYASADQQGMVITKRKGQPTFSLSRKLDGIDDERFLYVSGYAAWENAQPHEKVHWLQPRVVIAGFDAQMRFCAPLDHGVIAARGTRDWHRVQAVVELPPELVHARLSVDGFGEEGVMRLRDLRVEVVKQRSWFIPVTILLLGLWVLVLARIMRPYVRGRLPLVRAALMGCGILFGIWHFVFPQGRTLFVPVFGSFVAGPPVTANVVPPEEKPPVLVEEKPQNVVKPQTGQRLPRLRTIAPPDPDASKKTPDVSKPEEIRVVPIPVTPVTEADSRESMSFGQFLRDLDRKWNIESYNLTHFTAFFAIGLFVFGLAGTWRIWPLPSMVALMGEIIPNLLFDTWDRGDWWDLFANVSGLGVSLGAVMTCQRIWQKYRRRAVMSVE